ncbi:hypothetical protein [Vibrio gallicus]|uniref:hypothetical protein n=1 Tax=Vibrio gallicus TaxID=190897 RepID=UPI0021C3AFEB|nr:hypothetical protein [Vibrio gallicus]
MNKANAVNCIGFLFLNVEVYYASAEKIRDQHNDDKNPKRTLKQRRQTRSSTLWRFIATSHDFPSC